MNYHYPLETLTELTRTGVVRWIKYRDKENYTEYEGKDKYHKRNKWCVVYDKFEKLISIRFTFNDKIIYNRIYRLAMFPTAVDLLYTIKGVVDDDEIENYVPHFCKRG